MPVYKELIEGKQEIMVGYSDSAKVRSMRFIPPTSEHLSWLTVL
jgi:hypothetical protein